MKKVFIVTGEVSGDQNASWYLEKVKKQYPDMYVEAVGGDNLKALGVIIYEPLEKLNVAGVVEIVKKLGFILKFLKKLSLYITKNDFDQVVLVDFPGFNLRLAKLLKKIKPELEITYLAPPQVWIWGKCRIKKLKKFCDKFIVLYPFEVEWYKKNGLDVEFLGNPVCSKVLPYINNRVIDKNKIAILPASRDYELDNLLPVFAKVIKRIKLAFPKIKIVFPIADSFSVSKVEEKLRKFGLFNCGRDVFIVQGEKAKLKELSECCMAITKPGTISLELAILSIPAISVYKTSWITYFLGKLLVNIKYMSLPNLFLNKEVYKEFIQGKCTANLIFSNAKSLYLSILKEDENYKIIKKDLGKIKKTLCFSDLK